MKNPMAKHNVINNYINSNDNTIYLSPVKAE
jgi:hypothetical protein